MNKILFCFHLLDRKSDVNGEINRGDINPGYHIEDDNVEVSAVNL